MPRAAVVQAAIDEHGRFETDEKLLWEHAVIGDLERIYNEMAGETSGWEIAAAVLLLAASVLIALVIGWGLKRLLLRFSSVSIGVAVFASRASQLVITLIGAAWALSVANVGPGFTLVIVVAVAVVAALLAQTLITNIAAGMVLPYFVGDQIETHEHAGTVVDINLRQTVIETLDRRKVYIPNSDVLTNPIVVFSACEQRRSSLDVWIGYEADISGASRLLVDAASSVEGVEVEPAPYVIPSSFEDGRCLLILKWWHDTELRTAERIRGAVVTTVKCALDREGVEVSPPAAIFLSEWPRRAEPG